MENYPTTFTETPTLPNTVTHQSLDWTLIIQPEEWKTAYEYWLPQEKWTPGYKVAILGNGSSYHLPILTHVPTRIDAHFAGRRWHILQDAGVEYHLHASCETGFWAPAWTIQEVGLLRALRPIRTVPYLACSKCWWGPIRKAIQAEEALLVTGLDTDPPTLS